MDGSTMTDLDLTLSLLRQLRPSDVETTMLPAACYTSDAFFEWERREVLARQWHCVGRAEEIPETGDCLGTEIAGEPVVVARGRDGQIRALSRVCQHRGQVIPCAPKQSCKGFICPLHQWSYGLDGQLVGAPRMGDRNVVLLLRESVRLPSLPIMLWHGFIFVSLDTNVPPPALEKVEPFWDGYDEPHMKAVPPVVSDQTLPWNWKTHVENFTDAYHPEFVHRGTHDFAPSVLGDGGVRFTEMAPGDAAILRSVPLLAPDGGMMRDGWGPEAMFPAIPTLSDWQRGHLTFVMIPPSMTLIFAPGVIAYALIRPTGAATTLAANDRVTGGGWILPKTTLSLPDFAERAAQVREGGAKIWAQDVPVNLAMQAGKSSRFLPAGIYGPLERTLQQFNQWLLQAYHKALGISLGGDGCRPVEAASSPAPGTRLARL
ncbi:MAG TPA: aromatic ring-hydroxylating dioxygenase subunit alpha [Rhodopila sp.]|uniref:aromatic ring-hydroxylating oxygenase subunit alpha n=1 Tax=Rhodopila sp. TaxID=2480087 RepID=UPI002C2082FB|nr:aromatic ring-hydroxylating dioxygenase subunit alpha [Rhodopila sp.]HVY15818.1 aromatic ring-hydroxylating dioxygenase subunit alpha [Rhodopila sp.]